MIDLNRDSGPLFPPAASAIAPPWAHRAPPWQTQNKPLEQEQPEAETAHAAEPEPQQPRASAGSAHSRSYRQVKLEQLAEYIGEIARRILGSENRDLSSQDELRFGTHGSVSVRLDKGTWFDHENNVGGGVPQFIEIKGGIARGAVNDWLRDELGIEIEGWRAKRRLIT